jgi:hypothetical protein
MLVKGHRLVILSRDREAIEDELDFLGADRVRSVRSGNSKTDQEKVIGRIAQQVDGGVVIAPGDVNVRDVVRKLEVELPWIN